MSLKSEMAQSPLKNIFLAVVISFFVSGCISSNVVGNVDEIASRYEKPSGTLPIKFTLFGTEKLRSYGRFTGRVCGAHDFVYNFSETAQKSANTSLQRKFRFAGPTENVTKVELYITGMNPEMDCDSSFMSIVCQGSISILSTVAMTSRTGAVYSTKISARSDRTDGSRSGFCSAPANEADKNFASAYRQILSLVAIRVRAFIATNTPL
jgi:hypothetical protein